MPVAASSSNNYYPVSQSAPVVSNYQGVDNVASDYSSSITNEPIDLSDIISSTEPPESLTTLTAELNQMSSNIGNPLNTNHTTKKSSSNNTQSNTSTSSKHSNAPTAIALGSAGVIGAAALGAVAVKNMKNNSEQDEEEVEEEYGEKAE